MPDSYNLGETAAAAVLYSVLATFSVLAVGAAARDAWLRRQAGDKAPSAWRSVVQAFLHPSDHFLSARNSAPWSTIAVSYFASGMGAWIVYGTTEMVTPRPRCASPACPALPALPLLATCHRPQASTAPGAK